MTAEPSADVACVQLRATLPERILEALQPLLWMLSPNGIEVADALCIGGADVAQGAVRVTLYVAPHEAVDAAASLRKHAEALGVAVDVTAEDVRDQDWNRVWKQFYRPLQVGDRVRVEPAWMQGPDAPGLLRIAIDPGMAFGTGTHETTQLCMRQLVAWADRTRAQGGQLAELSMLDLGTGSAILAILGVRLGLQGAVGTEIDAAAVHSAQANLALNGVTDRVRLLHTGDPRQAGPAQYPVVVANILATVLVPLRDAIVDRVAPGGTLVLSGILSREADAVADHYAQRSLAVLDIAHDGAWSAIALHAPA